jgi:hypothetical protein
LGAIFLLSGICIIQRKFIANVFFKSQIIVSCLSISILLGYKFWYTFSKDQENDRIGRMWYNQEHGCVLYLS